MAIRLFLAFVGLVLGISAISSDVAPHQRVANFGPGPAALPVPVLEKAGQALLNFEGTGKGCCFFVFFF